MSWSADESAILLSRVITTQEPGVFFVRIGDGAIELLQGSKGQTCDGEVYRGDLAVAMGSAIVALKRGRAVIWGDWRGAVGGSRPKYCAEWEALIGPADKVLIDYEALLLMRESEALVEFYRKAKADPRRKSWVGMGSNTAGAMKLLGCGISISLGTGGQFDNIDVIIGQLEALKPEVVYFGAGMAGLCAVVRYWEAHPDTVCIHLGSALDPLFTGCSRGGQLSRIKAHHMLRELL